MRIQPMLLRLQSALGQDNLSEQMLLYPGVAPTQNSFAEMSSSSAKGAIDATEATSESIDETTNIVISYNGSPNSQTALDFAFWIAHQTKLATNKSVTVHVVYVLDSCNSLQLTCAAAPDLNGLRSQSLQKAQVGGLPSIQKQTATAVQSKPQSQAAAVYQPRTIQTQSARSLTDSLETADRILWQARCLADEWRGSLEAHLRFGAVAIELRQVVEAVKADVLMVGCTTGEHSLIQQLLTPAFPCPILGIPHELEKQ
ncbi:universal stress protein [Leptolyngbya sp. FACHB-711]|uniref:universal stress protein n=1 Tax=unclassified Leptolyngbya TaxID=2650499 RepID=UPI0018EF5D80|nr:universal stress protein [Leptolyngbya sp. FACHB-711]